MNRRNKWTTWLVCATLLLALGATVLPSASVNASAAQTHKGRKKRRNKQPQYNPFKGMGDVQGSIAAVTSNGGIDVKLGDNSIRHFTFLNTTTATFNGQPGKVTSLYPGMLVHVYFAKSDPNIATEVDAFPTLGR